MLERLCLYIKNLFESCAEMSIHTQMWTDGYSDYEIELAIKNYRNEENES